MERIRKRRSQAGISLLETVIALTILVMVSVGIMSMTAVAVQTTENQGHLQSRAAEYAQDKMEQLISLAYGDSTTDTTVFPAVSTGGSGLTVGGSSTPATPVTSPGTGYVDYLDQSGNLTTSSGNWYYIRVWEIDQASTNLKRITVTAQVRNSVGGTGVGVGALPTATVVSLKAYPF